MYQQRNTLPYFFLQKVHGFSCLLGLLALICTPVLSYAISASDFNLPAQDSEGWTILSPESDSYLVYVDASSGDDDTGQVYLPSDAIIGPAPQAPSNAIKAFKTLDAAYAQLREDKPDWMLLKSGETWLNQPLSLRRGQSATKRAVVAAYGTGARPELLTGVARAIQSTQTSNIVISGIKFWAHTRDIDISYFQSYSGADGFHFHTRPAGDVRIVSDVLIEDCVFRAYSNNVITGSLGSANNVPVVRVVFRRNIISGNYSTDSHAQGLFYTGEGQPADVPAAIFLEENLFDHNGWPIQQNEQVATYSTSGTATRFNHNTYFVDAKKVLFTGNIFMRASSIHNKWTADNGAASANSIEVNNNLYVEGELGLSAVGNNPGAFRFKSFKFNDNVMTDIGRTQPTNRGLAWYIQIGDWDGGEIIGNLLLNQTNSSVDNLFAMQFLAEEGTKQLNIKNNYIYNLQGSSTVDHPLLWFENGENTTDVQFMNNIVQQVSLSETVASIDVLGGYYIRANTVYYSDGNLESWFIINNEWANLADWVNYTGDTQAVAEPPSWSDPKRNIERYAGEVGLGGSFDKFIAALHKQSKSTWRVDLTAPKINNWFREGFVPVAFETTLDLNNPNANKGKSPIVMGGVNLGG